MKDKNILLGLLNNNLANSANSALHAYPQLREFVVSVQRALAEIVETTIIEGADRELSGNEPWAMMYALNTGRKICIPDRRSVLQSPTTSLPYGYISHVPNLRHIVDYILTYRGVTEMGYLISNQLPNTEITVCAQENWCKIRFDDNDMSLFIPNIYSTVAHVECPLFDVPREVLLNTEWMIKNIISPLRVWLTGVPYERTLNTERDSRYLIIDHYFTEQGENELSEDHPYNVLYDIMKRGQFVNQPSITHNSFKRSGYLAILEFKKNLYLELSSQRHPNRNIDTRVIVISSVFSVVDGEERSISHWYENPLLVNDIKEEMDDILTRLVASQA